MKETQMIETKWMSQVIREPTARRDFIRRLGLTSAAAGLVMVTPGWAAEKTAATVPSQEQDLAMLNVALGLEYQGIAAYQVGAESGLLQKPVLETALRFQSDHKAHAALLAATVQKFGGKAVQAKKPQEYGFPVDKLKNQADVLRFAAGLEKGASIAYLGTVPNFSNRDFARVAASILGDEAMHWAVLLSALGEDPVPVAFIPEA
jgi:rubrerythrin